MPTAFPYCLYLLCILCRVKEKYKLCLRGLSGLTTRGEAEQVLILCVEEYSCTPSNRYERDITAPCRGDHSLF